MGAKRSVESRVARPRFLPSSRNSPSAGKRVLGFRNSKNYDNDNLDNPPYILPTQSRWVIQQVFVRERAMRLAGVLLNL